MINTIPNLGIGTFRLQDKIAYESVKMALEVGYRHIDTAQIYGNEKEVGQAIRNSKVKREDIFLTTKIWIENLGKVKFQSSLKQSLSDLQTEYLDLLLIHWPTTEDDVTMSEYLSALKDVKEKGIAKNIGVSNFTIAQLKQAIEILGKDIIYTNQIEVHPYLNNKSVTDFCEKNNILVTGYMPFAYGDVLKDQIIKDIAASHNATTAQVVLSWMRNKNFITIPSSTKHENLVNNLLYKEIQLTSIQIQYIDLLDKGKRYVSPDFAPEWD